MKIFFKKFRYASKFTLWLAVILVIYFEWLEYSITSYLYWPKLSVNSPSDETIKILIVGDPQLLGYRYTVGGHLGTICRWDADRYVRKTFHLAYNYVNPDIVIFLGDNFDEGEIAPEDEFIATFQRFKQVFREVDFNKALIVPGDNDIGGEDQPPEPQMEKRFNKYFRNDVFVRYRFLELVKVNYITRSNSYRVVPNISDSSVRIILSHIPLTPSYSTYLSRLIPHVQPHIILSAHDHKSQHVLAERKTGIIIQTPSASDFTSSTFNISEDIIHEITVPSCSYRMGTPNMGYGVLLINNKEASYLVLQLPYRFRQLLVLLFVAVAVFLYSIVYFSKYFFRHYKTVSYVNQYTLLVT